MTKLNDIFKINPDEMKECKIHLSSKGGETTCRSQHPIDVFFEDEEECRKWNERKGNPREDGKGGVKKQKFPEQTKYILFFVKIYKNGEEKKKKSSSNTYLLAGSYEIIDRSDPFEYKIEHRNKFSEYIGRLVVKHNKPKNSRNVHRQAETVLDEITVCKILTKRATEEDLPTLQSLISES